MNFILRNFFYGVGLTILGVITQLPAANAQFRDLVSSMQALAFWQIAGCAAAILAGLDFAFSGRAIISERPAILEMGDAGPKRAS